MLLLQARKAAVASHRRPQAVELHERENIESCIRDLVASRLTGVLPGDIAVLVADRFPNLGVEDRKIVVDSISDALKRINAINAPAWGVAAHEGRQYALVRDGGLT